MKRTYGKLGWLIASICFFGMACLGVALDEPQVNPPSSRQQASRQEAPPAKAATPAPRKAPEPVAPTPAPPSSPAVQPAPQPVPSAPAQPPGGKPVPPAMAEALKEGIFTGQMPPERLWQELERDKSNYPKQVWCKAADTCAAKVVPNVNGTQWRARANMSVQSFHEFNSYYTGFGYRLASRQYYVDANGVEFHQAVWLKDN
jgi:hypothetical protein